MANSAPSKGLKPRQILPKARITDTKSLVQSADSGSNSSREGSGFGDHSPPALEVFPKSTSNTKSLLIASSPLTGPGHSDPGALIQQGDRSVRAPMTQSYLQLFSPKPCEAPTSLNSALLDRLFLNFSRLPSSPSDPTLGYLNGLEFEVYVVSYYYRRMMEFSYFKPTKDQSERIRKVVISRLRGSQYHRWLKLLSIKICEAIAEEDKSQSENHIRWIGNIETVIWRKLNQDHLSHEADGLRGDWLEVSLIKTALMGTSNAYMLLRGATPMFLQSVYALPDLWTNTSDPTFVPLLSLTSSEDHRLASFALMDSVCAMLFGLPQQVEYNTNTGQLPKSLHPHEWAHSSPIEFHVLLAEINACRDKCSGARDWEEIEHSLVHWQSRAMLHDENWESWMTIAWLAVQESWRLSLLVYLYLAVCRCPSDDPRIQRCVTQILQVIGTVKRESSYTSIQFLIQYLMVGICARSEKHRKIVRNKLSDQSQTKFWMMRGSEFIPLLDYLWHGAGSDGRPITWDDYVCSRQVFLPVSL